MGRKKPVEERMKKLIDKTKLNLWGVCQQYHSEMSKLEEELFKDLKTKNI